MKKFLVIQLARFGDIIQSKRLILALQKQGNVSLLIDNNLIKLAKIIYPTVNCIGIAVSSATSQNIWQENTKIFEYLQKEQFDEIYPLNHSPISQSITALFEAEKLIGYSRSKGYLRQSNWVRMAFRYLANRKTTPINLVDFWGLFTDTPYPADKVNPQAVGKGQGLGIVLSGQHARRSLSARYYAKIIPIVFQRLLQANQLQDKTIFLLGTDKEQKFAQELISCLPPKILPFVKNYAGKTSFEDLQEILLGLELLLSPDTGTAHFASHLGTPVEGFFLSSANMFETGPYGLGHTIWQSYLPCSPCKEFQTCTMQQNNEPACLTAFNHPHFLYHLLHGKFDEESLKHKHLQHIVPYFSAFSNNTDEFATFLNWQSPIQIPEDIQRQKGKNILENYCAAQKNTVQDIKLHNIEENAIYTDTDFMLPQVRP